MQRLHILLFAGLFAAGIADADAQKAWPGDINLIIAKVPVPSYSSTCYATATKTTDPSSGQVSIKDNGEAFKSLEAQLNAMAKDALTGMSMNSASATPPTAEQIEQMKQQALQRAAAAQSTTPQQYVQQQQASSGVPSASQVSLMKQISQAQTAASQISQLCNEIAQKKSRLNKDSVQAVKMKNCPDVRQGSYVGPLCQCVQENDIAYYTARVAVMDQYLAQITALIREYLPRIKAQTSIVDDMEAKARYGDAVTNPAFKQMVVNIQRQSLGGVTILLALSSDAWEDGAVEFANEANAKSGAMTHCK